MTKFKVSAFEQMLKWSGKEFQHLPWRVKRSPYHTLVSEIMLQQTTVKTVLNHFERFLKQYPTIEILAEATEDEIQVAWKGLGYYRRARNLLKAAKSIVGSHNGCIPASYEELVSIPGIGDYTACAIMSLAYEKKAIAIDANIGRVLSRIWGLKTSELSPLKMNKMVKEAFEERFHSKIKFKKYREFNEALMDVGRVFCQARSVNCSICPLANDCQSYRKGEVQKALASKPKKVNKYFELDVLRLIIKNKNNKILMQYKEKSEWLQGQYELPTFTLKAEDEQLNQYPSIKLKSKDIPADHMKSAITKYKIKNYYQSATKEFILKTMERRTLPKNLQWIDFEDERIAHVSLKILNEYRKKYG